MATELARNVSALERLTDEVTPNPSRYPYPTPLIGDPTRTRRM